jgi:heat shock protein HtpX
VANRFPALCFVRASFDHSSREEYDRTMAGASRELFPTDRGLVARMAVAAVATPLVVLAALVAVVAVAPTRLVIGVGIAMVVGLFAAIQERAATVRARELAPEAAPELHAAVERLCVIANLPKPRIVLEQERQPNSWIVATGRDRARLHLTRGLVERLEPRELEAVIAHELAHLAHRDAIVMTVVGGPGAVLLSGGSLLAGRWIWPLQLGGLLAAAIGWVASLGTRALSRYREFAADAGAVAVTGNPAVLATALMKVSDGVHALPTRDLRVAAARDAFHLLPVARERALTATHPSLKARIARLERMEARLQSARPAVSDRGR